MIPPDTTSADAFESLSLQRLRTRTSEKWALYPPDVLPAFVAEMDFPLAPAIRAALHAAVDDGDTGYAMAEALQPAFARFAQQRFSWNIDPVAVLVLPDVMSGVALALHALTRPGDGVVINPPVYPPFFEVIRGVERRVVAVPLQRAASGVGWMLDFVGLERAFRTGARAFLLCSPHNPVGRVWSRQELRRVAELARAYDVPVIADEIHAPLTMPGVPFTPYLTAGNDAQSGIALTSASKAWNVAGLKCALLALGTDAGGALRERYDANPTEYHWRAGQFGAIAALAAFRDGGEWLDALRAHLGRNRDLLGTLLAEQLPGARYTPPDAGFLGWVDCSELGLGPDPAARFLKRGRVAVEAGAKFGEPGAPFVRVNFGTSSAILREIVGRMAASR